MAIIEPDLLMARGARQRAFHEDAWQATRARFGRQVFVRAVVEVSNFCRENCNYCGMRRDNRALERYRASLDTLTEVLVHQRPASVTEVNIQGGEDPRAVREVVLPLIRVLRQQTPLGIIVSLGTLDPSLYDELHAGGASVYIMKFEDADPVRYLRIRAPGSLAERLAHIRLLAERGWRVSSGFIAGLPGQEVSDLSRGLQLADELPLVGCSVSPFIAGSQTPLKDIPHADVHWTLNCMAGLRLMRPGWVIPAVSALSLASLEGYRLGLRAGANLVTINLTPPDLRNHYVIYRRERIIMTEERILAALSAEGLAPSPVGLVRHLEQHSSRESAALQPA